jgi:hypothetical protein
MTIPGFSAEVSIYQSTATYFVASFSSSADGVALGPVAKLIPQMIAQSDYWNCVAEHVEAGFPMGMSGGFYCRGEEGDPRSGSAPDLPDLQCQPGCTPCRRVAGKSGRWKTCTKRNCDDYEVRCQ